MGRIANRRLAQLAIPALSLMSFWGMSTSSALAAAPLGQRVARFESQPAVNSRPALDLRSPMELHAVAVAMVSERSAEAFPSSLHRQNWNAEAQEQNGASALSSLGAQYRMDSPLQALARRVHREGLPVARLWENKSALVSLGLNQKGKPGLWIIQKLH
jgi:hypothetical protein